MAEETSSVVYIMKDSDHAEMELPEFKSHGGMAMVKDDENAFSDKSAENVLVRKSLQANQKNHITEVDFATFFCGLGIACIMGAFSRMSANYYQIWRIETNYSFQYYNIAGSLLMGFFIRHKSRLFNNTNTKFYQVLFVSLTTGYCGCLTSFSTLQLECNKNFMLQWDLTWGNSIGSQNGGRFFEWLTCLFSGIAVPLVALQIGRYCARWSPLLKEGWDIELSERVDLAACYAVRILFAISLFLIVILCSAVYPSWIHILFAAIFSVFGGYTRYRLSTYNSLHAQFPLGTFICNVSGTWLISIFVVFSKFAVPYYSTLDQAVLYGLVFGYCGSLTTVSTFVKELNEIPDRACYIYGSSSSLVAQVGIILLYNVYAFSTVSVSRIDPNTINICQRSSEMCGEFLMKTGCLAGMIVNAPCSDWNDYRTYDSTQCRCGNFASDHFSELLVDSQMKHNINRRATFVWPNKASKFSDPTNTMDVCLTYSDNCIDYFSRINCPTVLRSNNACDRHGITQGRWECTCGGHDTPGDRLLELITDTALMTQFDLTPYVGYASQDIINFEYAFDDVCKNMLEHANCPSYLRTIRSNSISGDYTTWIGTCQCGDNYNVNSVRVAENIFDAVVRPWALSLLVRPDPTVQLWDGCASYANICSFWLEKMACPVNLKVIKSCFSADSTLNGTIAAYDGICACGTMDVLTDRPLEWVIDSLLEQRIWKEFYHIILPRAPYTTVVQSSAFKQFL